MASEDYGTISGWRNYYSGLDSTTISDAVATRFLTESIRQVQQEGTQMVRNELVTKDGTTNYYFTRYRYFADMEMASPDASVGTDDIVVYEYNSTNRVFVDITDQVATIDGLNNYFTLNSGYPTSSRSVYVNYRFLSKPLTELVGDGSTMKKAVFEYMTVLALRSLKVDRLSGGIITYTSGGETVTRDEKSFDELVDQHLARFHQLIRGIKPLYMRGMRTGRGTASNNMGSNLRRRGPPYTFGGRLLYD